MEKLAGRFPSSSSEKTHGLQNEYGTFEVKDGLNALGKGLPYTISIKFTPSEKIGSSKVAFVRVVRSGRPTVDNPLFHWFTGHERGEETFTTETGLNLPRLAATERQGGWRVDKSQNLENPFWAVRGVDKPISDPSFAQGDFVGSYKIFSVGERLKSRKAREVTSATSKDSPTGPWLSDETLKTQGVDTKDRDAVGVKEKGVRDGYRFEAIDTAIDIETGQEFGALEWGFRIDYVGNKEYVRAYIPTLLAANIAAEQRSPAGAAERQQGRERAFAHWNESYARFRYLHGLGSTVSVPGRHFKPKMIVWPSQEARDADYLLRGLVAELLPRKRGASSIPYLDTQAKKEIVEAAAQKRTQDEEIYSNIKQQIQATQDTHPKFYTDDRNLRVESGYSRLELVEINKSVKQAIEGGINVGGNWIRPVIDNLFETSLVQEISKLDIEAGKPFNYRAYDISAGAWASQWESGGKVLSASASTNKVRLRALLRGPSQDGLLVADAHGQSAPKGFLIKELSYLKSLGVNTLYLEDFRVEYQAEIDDYLAAPAGSPFPLRLELLLKAKIPGMTPAGGSFKSLLEEAKSQGIRVRCLDFQTSRRLTEGPPGEIYASRVRRFNYEAALAIQNDAPRRGGGKYVVLVGEAHIHSEQGYAGLSQRLGVLGIHPPDRSPDDPITVLIEDIKGR